MELACVGRKLYSGRQIHTVKVDFATVEVEVDASASELLASSARTKAAARIVAPTAKRIVTTPAISQGQETTNGVLRRGREEVGSTSGEAE